MASGLLFLTFIICLMLNMPIAISLGTAALLGAVIMDIVPVEFLAQASVTSVDSFPLMAVPFFILAGDIMGTGGVSNRLLNLGNKIVGSMHGGLAIVTIITCMVFAAISGSGPATVAAIGSIMIPAMIQQGYDPGFSAALNACSGTLGPIIPPSIIFIVYGIVAEVSISDLFLAGFLPGFIMTSALCLTAYVISRKRGYRGLDRRASFREVLEAANEAKYGLLMPVVILGGIYGGIFTPTEAAIIAVDYGLIVGIFVHKEMQFRDLWDVLRRSALTSGSVLIIVGLATVFGNLLTLEGVPMAVANFIVSLSDNKYVIMLLINIFLLFVGCVMESLAAIIILTPILLPVVKAVGVDPLHFGIILAVNLVIGMVTPPVGVNLFVASSVSKLRVEVIAKNAVPFIGTLLVALMVVTYIPWFSLVLVQAFK